MYFANAKPYFFAYFVGCIVKVLGMRPSITLMFYSEEFFSPQISLPSWRVMPWLRSSSSGIWYYISGYSVPNISETSYRFETLDPTTQ
jgi:hypothetical protein